MSLNIDSDHLVRYCKRTQIEDGRVLIAAFILRVDRSPPESTLSTDWFEYFRQDHYVQIKNALLARHFQPRQNAYLARFKIRPVIESVKKEFQIDLEIANDHGSHTLVKNLTKDAAKNFLPAIVETVPLP